MSTTAVATEVLFSAAEVARVLKLEAWAVRKLHPGVFPTPANWREDAKGNLSYTPAGLLALATELEKRGYGTRAHTLKVFVVQRQSTPSRQLATGIPKNGSPWFRSGQME